MATGKNPGIRIPSPDETHPNVILAIQQIIKEFGWQASPKFKGLSLSGLTSHGLLFGSSTGVVTSLSAATNGQLPIGSTGADPVLATISEGEGIDVTNAAGSITIAGEDASTTNKGVASFSSTYFSVASGAVSLIAGGGLNHNDLGGLQGGTAAKYYHLTDTEHGYVSGANAQSVLTTASPTYTGLSLVNAASLSALVKWTATTGYGEFAFQEGTVYKGFIGAYGSTYGAPQQDAFIFTAAADDTGTILFRTKTGGSYATRMTLTNAGGLIVSGLTASRLMASDGSKTLSSITNLASWVAGTANQITVTDDTDGTITLSGPQNLHTAAIPTFGGVVLTGSIDLDLTNTVAGGASACYLGVLQGTNALTGTLRGLYSVVTNGEFASSGTIRAIEGKARAATSGLVGGNVGTLEGMSITADAKNKTITTLRGAEIIMDGQAGAAVTLATGLRISNNFQAAVATTSYGLQIYRDSFDYTADIQLSSGGLIGGSTGALNIDNAGKVCIGTTSALGIGSNFATLSILGGYYSSFMVTEAASLRTVTLVCSNTAAHNPQINLWHSRGTYAAPTATVSGDTLGTISFAGYTTAFRGGASITAVADAEWATGGSGTDCPTRLAFNTCPDGSATQAERMRISSNGYVGIGTLATANEMLEVAGKIRALTAFNLNGTDGVTQATAVGKVCDVTALAGGIATAQTQITYIADGAHSLVGITSITTVNGRITAMA